MTTRTHQPHPTTLGHGPEPVLEPDAIVTEADRTFTLDPKPAPLERRRNHDRVDDLEQTRPQLTMNTDRRVYDGAGDVVKFHLRVLRGSA